MREIINAQPGYEEFPVSDAPMIGGQIEVTHTGLTFPSIIVETAFHTNPDDAVALLDPVFQSAAMKGVEKGYRLHRQNEDCTPYEITDVPDVSAPWGSSALVSISFEGFPQYPVELEVVDAECSTICTPGGGTLPSEWPSPIQLNMSCDGDPDSPPASAFWRVTLRDADGVETEHEYNSYCGGGASPAAKQSLTPTDFDVRVSDGN